MTKKSVDAKAAKYMPTRGTFGDPNRSGAGSILRAVDKGGEIQMATLAELVELLRTSATRRRRFAGSSSRRRHGDHAYPVAAHPRSPDDHRQHHH